MCFRISDFGFATSVKIAGNCYNRIYFYRCNLGEPVPQPEMGQVSAGIGCPVLGTERLYCAGARQDPVASRSGGPGAYTWFMAREGFQVSGIDCSGGAIDNAIFYTNLIAD
jgi:hypothetical protein